MFTEHLFLWHLPASPSTLSTLSFSRAWRCFVVFNFLSNAFAFPRGRDVGVREIPTLTSLAESQSAPSRGAWQFTYVSIGSCSSAHRANDPDTPELSSFFHSPCVERKRNGSRTAGQDSQKGRGSQAENDNVPWWRGERGECRLRHVMSFPGAACG